VFINSKQNLHKRKVKIKVKLTIWTNCIFFCYSSYHN